MNIHSFKILRNQSTREDIEMHLKRCSSCFKPKLSEYVEIESYSTKLFMKADRFELWPSGVLRGLIAVYFNADQKSLYISNLSLESNLQGKGLAQRLFETATDSYLYNYSITKVFLEVYKENEHAVTFYEKLGFVRVHEINTKILRLEKVYE